MCYSTSNANTYKLVCKNQVLKNSCSRKPHQTRQLQIPRVVTMYARHGRKVAQENISVIQEEHRADIRRMVASEDTPKTVIKKEIGSLDSTACANVYGTEKQETRATSPLDTIAEVACRLGMRLPLIPHRGSKEMSLPANAFGGVASCQEHGSDSPTSIPTQSTKAPAPPVVTEQGGLLGHEVSVCLHSLLRMLGSDRFESVSNDSFVEQKLDKNGGNEGANNRKSKEHVSEEIGSFKDVIVMILEKIVQDVYKVKAEVVSLQEAIERMQRERCCGKPCQGQEEAVTVRQEDVGKAWMIPQQDENCEDEDGTACGEKRERKSDDWISPESEVGGGRRKKMKTMVTGKNLRQRMERSESITRTESVCISGKSDWDYTESGTKRLRRDGVTGKGSKGKIVKRRRDNWTEEENMVFTGMVLGNQDAEEMTLRRMLARRFSPRRTHEQCANHLRILRAQRKLPPAREESAICVMKKDK